MMHARLAIVGTVAGDLHNALTMCDESLSTLTRMLNSVRDDAYEHYVEVSLAEHSNSTAALKVARQSADALHVVSSAAIANITVMTHVQKACEALAVIRGVGASITSIPDESDEDDFSDPSPDDLTTAREYIMQSGDPQLIADLVSVTAVNENHTDTNEYEVAGTHSRVVSPSKRRRQRRKRDTKTAHTKREAALHAFAYGTAQR